MTCDRRTLPSGGGVAVIPDPVPPVVPLVVVQTKLHLESTGLTGHVSRCWQGFPLAIHNAFGVMVSKGSLGRANRYAVWCQEL